MFAHTLHLLTSNTARKVKSMWSQNRPTFIRWRLICAQVYHTFLNVLMEAEKRLKFTSIMVLQTSKEKKELSQSF